MPPTSLGVDLVHAQTSNSSLVLYGSPRALLCGLLANSLSVYSAIDLGPCELSGVLPLQEEGLLLAAAEAEDLAVHADVKTTPTGVDLVARECVSADRVRSTSAVCALERRFLLQCIAV